MSDLKCGRKTNLCSTCPNRSMFPMPELDPKLEHGLEVEDEGGLSLFAALAVAVIALAVVLVALFAARVCS